MSEIISKLGMDRVCLISFILLYSVFTIEYAFSSRYLKGDDFVATYDRSEHSITFKFLFYDSQQTFHTHCFLKDIVIKYSEDGTEYKSLIKACTGSQENQEKKWMQVLLLGKEGVFEFPQSCKIERSKSLVWVKTVDDRTIKHHIWRTSKTASMCIKWTVPKYYKTIQFVNFSGIWYDGENLQTYIFEYDYRLANPKSSSNAMKNAPTIFKSERSDNVKVTGETDAINVTGAELGENIKIYTVSGAELKSVVANDNVVNIKLPTNQMYVVKIGQTRHKVAL